MSIASVIECCRSPVLNQQLGFDKVTEDVAEAQQNGRLSLIRPVKDMRTAGFGLLTRRLPSPLGAELTSPITVTTSGGSGPGQHNYPPDRYEADAGERR